MACVESAPLANAESEMEEGEIIDELDELSDISSEEEFLLRQRLEVLENYNNVLERKEAKRTTFSPGPKKWQKNILLRDLSEISTSELEEVCANNNKKVKDIKCLKTYSRQKKRKELCNEVVVKKKTTRKKKKLPLKVISESSEESDDEYRNKRRKLANAVVVNKEKLDTSTLKSRLNNMIHGFKITPLKIDKQTETEKVESELDVILPPEPLPQPICTSNTNVNTVNNEFTAVYNELIDLCTEEESRNLPNAISTDVVDGVPVNIETKDKQEQKDDSDEDLELLRQHALKTKTKKVKQDAVVEPQKVNSEDEDSDTAELRLICLKSAMLKEAIERKQKQKLKKRLSQSSNLQDSFLIEKQLLQSDNNTDIESVDMDMGSDVDEKSKDPDIIDNAKTLNKDMVSKQDELDEDEDLLRARLLTSLSKNLPHLVDPKIMSALDKDSPKKPLPKKPIAKPVAVEKIIINLGESDSEGEHEATKNLAKMHMKLSEQVDFQQQLDLFLKSARMEVECNKLPDVVQKPLPKTPSKYVPKAVNHLPKSEQIEYKSLIKRMAELEKIKQARQTAMNIVNDTSIGKDTLKQRNVTVENTTVMKNRLDEQIALSRKRIAEESAKIMKLKEESTKLAQKYKIVATELKNLATAITFNKKEQRITQMQLTKIRQQHQHLLKSSNMKHSNQNLPNINRVNNKLNTNNRQKENNPSTTELKNTQVLKTLKVSVVNDFKENTENTATNTRLSVEINVSNNTKTVTAIKSDMKERVTDMQVQCNNQNEKPETVPCNKDAKNTPQEDDYESPLQALQSASWNEDPNKILCPFEVGGNCKDPDCKYMHPKIPQ